MKKWARNILLIGLISFLWPLTTAANSVSNDDDAYSSKTFNPNYIIDDYDLTDVGSMSLDSIRRFLSSKSGILGSYRAADIDGIEREAAEIIWRAAVSHGISAKFIIALIQREQSLIENPNPSARDLDWAAGYAICDSCRTDDPALQKFKGFAVQVDRAAWRQKYYIEHPEEFMIQVGEPSLIDGAIVTPVNRATANLYIYTPHLNGNRNFWFIWNSYFLRRYPDGTLLKERGTDDIWLLSNGKLRLVVSRAALMSDYDQNKIINVSSNDILRYDLGQPIKFPNYSLIRSTRGTVYLLVNEVRRGIASKEIFRRLGFNPEEVIDASWDDINMYAEGVPITSAEAKPTGELLQNSKTGGVYYVYYGVRHPIKSREILRSRFARYPIKPVSAETLDKYYLGDAVKFKDAELVTAKGQTTVYVISNGQKRPIASEDIFTELGYQWSNIVVTTYEALAVHPDGEPVAG